MSDSRITAASSANQESQSIEAKPSRPQGHHGDDSSKGTAATTALGAGALAFPNVARGQVTWTMQAGWPTGGPTGDILWEYAQDLVRMMNEMSGGRLNVNLLPAGSVVGALELQDAVVGGALDGSHGVTAYWYGKNKAASRFGTPPAFGWNAHEFMGWMWYGGGQELYEELVQEILGLDLVGFLYGPMPTQAFGWFREPINSVEQLSGLRYRTVGLAADLYEELGAAVTILGGPDIVPALDRGVIDASCMREFDSWRLLSQVTAMSEQLVDVPQRREPFGCHQIREVTK